MLPWLRKAPPSRIPSGHRVYAVGDIHGRLDLLEALLCKIEEDNRTREPAKVSLILLGDLIDRGPDSYGVIQRVKAGVDWAKMIALMGNHEAIMLKALDGDRDVLDQWLRFGGIETLTSWGIPAQLLKSSSREEIIQAARAAIEPTDRAWLWRMQTAIRIGDYYFVHAGIRPSIPLDKQIDDDRLWIRDEFLKSRKQHEAIVVHGHSINEEVEVRLNRIGIDTGAYMTGCLTAVGLESTEQWFLSAKTLPAGDYLS